MRLSLRCCRAVRRGALVASPATTLASSCRRARGNESVVSVCGLYLFEPSLFCRFMLFFSLFSLCFLALLALFFSRSPRSVFSLFSLFFLALFALFSRSSRSLSRSSRSFFSRSSRSAFSLFSHAVVSPHLHCLLLSPFLHLFAQHGLVAQLRIHPLKQQRRRRTVLAQHGSSGQRCTGGRREMRRAAARHARPRAGGDVRLPRRAFSVSGV